MSEEWDCPTCNRPMSEEHDYECCACEVKASEHLRVTTMCKLLRASQGRESSLIVENKRLKEQCSNLDDQVSAAMMVIRGLERERYRVAEALKDVMKYRKGEKPYDYWRLPESHRGNAQFDGWNEIEDRINAALASVKGGQP